MALFKECGIDAADPPRNLPGAATVKLLVEGDGGTVRALSNSGEGCTFLITYPLVPVRTD